MNTIPFDVRRYLYKQWNQRVFFAYILIDKLDFSIEWSENISSLYGINLNENQPIEEQLIFLQGIYPYEENYPLILDEVNFSTNRTADIHIVPSRYKLCILLFDVTKTVQLHQELQQKRNELKLLYEQEMRSIRTLKHSYEELKKQKEFAETANRTKSEFLQHIVCDLKPPLNVILGFTQLLEIIENPLIGDAQKYVQEIKHSSIFLLSLINEISSVSEIETETDTIKINSQILSVSTLIQESIETLKPIAEKNKIDFICRFEKNLPSISLDPFYFRQIIFSILSNAIKYNRKNGCIIISGYIAKNNTVHINIKDTGIGIDSDYLSSIFEPYKYDCIQNTQTKNSLSVCKKLTELMQGRIEAYSDVGIGSLFWLEFPLNKQPPVEINRQNKQTVLYIEDNQAYLFLMNCFLEQYQGCGLLNAKNVPDIFELINNHPISVILLDTDTFASDYLDILHALKTHHKSKNMPVIALFNANTELVKIKTALNAGFYDYIIKPFDFNLAMELFDRLAMIL